MNDYEWLNDLSKDDEVIIYSGTGMGCPYDLAIVTNITKTQIQVALKKYNNVVYKFRRDGGSQIGGDSWHSKLLKPVTPEILDQIAAYNIKTHIYSLLKKMSEHTTNLPLDRESLKEIYQHLNNANTLVDQSILKRKTK